MELYEEDGVNEPSEEENLEEPFEEEDLEELSEKDLEELSITLSDVEWFSGGSQGGTRRILIIRYKAKSGMSLN